MKKIFEKLRKAHWLTRTIVALVIVVPESLIFLSAYSQMGDIFALAAFSFLWPFGIMTARFYLFHSWFGKREHFRDHIHVLFLVSNYFFFGFGTWIFAEVGTPVYRFLPYLLMAGFFLIWVGQKKIFWELFTFATLFLGISLGWFVTIVLAFSGGTLAAITVYSIFVAAINWARIHHLPTSDRIFFALMLSLIVGEISWVLLLWPIRLLSLSGVMLAVFYVVGVLLLLSKKSLLEKKHVFQHTLAGFVLFVALCVTSQWTLPPSLSL
jgi:hypothetical protein